MIYHNHGFELNSILITLRSHSINLNINFSYKQEDSHLEYIISYKGKEQTGIIYQFKKCKETSPIDSYFIKFFELNKYLYGISTCDNTNICNDCLKDLDLCFIHYDNDGDLDLFCIHSSFIDDTLIIFKNIIRDNYLT
jgi:hypothetical protein